MTLQLDHSLRAFKQFKSGDPEALGIVFADEKPRLFDFGLRLTGQIIKTSETIAEVFDSVEPIADDCETLQDLRVTIYKTLRSFAADAWNAETNKLENPLYANQNAKDHQHLQIVEDALRRMSPSQREAILLYTRLDFDEHEVSLITGRSLSDTQMDLAQAQSALEEASGLPSTEVMKHLSQVLSFVEPEHTDLQTQNLSLLMHDFKKTAGLKIGRSPWFWVFLAVLMGAAGFAYWKADEIRGREDSESSPKGESAPPPPAHPR